MDELDPKAGDFLGRIALPMANVAWLIADARAKLPMLTADDLEEMLATIQVRVEYLQSLAIRLDHACLDCPLKTRNSTLEDTMDLAFGQSSSRSDDPGKNDS